MKQQNNPIPNGFTLVELAIVLMIIGLLIGGVLRGQELLVNGRITSTIQQVKSYQAAIHTFGDTYGSIPGDMPIASTKLPGCQDGNPNHCVNGNGDATIGVLNPGQGTYANEPWQPVDPAIASENSQFWKHLALAHLITGIDPSAATPEWGKSHPISKLANAGFFARYTNFNVTNFPTSWTGTILVLKENIDGQYCVTAGFCAISPMRAWQLDRKMDDGVSATGNVWAISNNWSNGCGINSAGINGPNGYAENNSQETCDMMFLMN